MSRLQSPSLAGASHTPISSHGGFTLIEMLVSLGLIGMLLVILMSMINQVSSVWGMTSGKIEQFQEVREAFEAITRRLSTATLNTYWDYDNPSTPSAYVRQSELRFLSGPLNGANAIAGNAPEGKSWQTHGVFFQAPLGNSEPGQSQLSGLYSLLNTRGYFVEYGDLTRPDIPGITIVKSQYRFRLCELVQPTSDLNIYHYTSGLDNTGTAAKSLAYTGNDWFTPALNLSGTTRPVHILATNVIAMVLLPHLSQEDDSTGTLLAPQYIYDSSKTGAAASLSGSAAAKANSKNQLPPMILFTMVVIDEKSANRLDHGTTTPPDIGVDMTTIFQQASSYSADLATLENALQAHHIQYRIFTSNIRIKGAKWSTEETN
ncbi:MAG: Verru_Chthon cassette protein C [Chthoniobacteraceae bacterium]